MHRQHVDDVGPVVAMSVAVAEQVRGDRVSVGLVVDQDAAEGVASLPAELLEKFAEVAIFYPSLPSISSMSRTAR
jgi:hypothetical protein